MCEFSDDRSVCAGCGSFAVTDYYEDCDKILCEYCRAVYSEDLLRKTVPAMMNILEKNICAAIRKKTSEEEPEPNVFDPGVQLESRVSGLEKRLLDLEFRFIQAENRDKAPTLFPYSGTCAPKPDFAKDPRLSEESDPPLPGEKDSFFVIFTLSLHNTWVLDYMTRQKEKAEAILKKRESEGVTAFIRYIQVGLPSTVGESMR